MPSNDRQLPGTPDVSPITRGDDAERWPTEEPRSEPPRKQHGDALIDGSGSRQGSDPDPSRDAAPRE